MAAWQIVFLAVVVLVPLLLLSLFHGHGERLSSRGVPIERAWYPRRVHAPPEDAHH